MLTPSSCGRGFGTWLAMHCRQCHREELFEPNWPGTLKIDCGLLFRIRAEECRLNRSNIFLSPFHQPREGLVWVSQLSIKSFAIMVVQLMIAAAKVAALR